MSSRTDQILEDTRRKLFESDEFQVNRELIQWVQPNSGESDNLDVLLDRVKQFAPGLKQWAESFNERSTDNTEQ